ncbi:MAG: universal stress protein [Planctomycetota bacterium]|jgi:nucleotide-binding universal stress UspA family protein
MRIKTILALSDLCEDSITGLRTAYALADRKGAKLVVGHVLVPRTLDPSNVKEFLADNGFDPAAATIEIEVDADVMSGIDLLIEQSAPDLIVLSSTRKRGISRLVAASIPVGLVGDTRTPLLVMHTGQDQERFMKALVCVDGSEQSQELVDAASRLLDDKGEIVALMVIEDSPLVIGGIHIGLHNEEVLKAADEAASRFLGQLRLQRSDLALKTDHRVGNAVETILEARKAHGADLVVIGSGGIGGESIFFFSKVAGEVVRYADVPALIVPTNHSEA